METEGKQKPEESFESEDEEIDTDLKILNNVFTVLPRILTGMSFALGYYHLGPFFVNWFFSRVLKYDIIFNWNIFKYIQNRITY